VNERDYVVAMVKDILGGHCSYTVVESSEGSWAPELWARIDQAGLSSIGVPESAGGSGGDLRDAIAVVIAAAEYAAPVPLAETLLIAPRLRESFTAPHRPGPASVATGAQLTAAQAGEGYRVVGDLGTVSWGHVTSTVLAVASVDTGGMLLCEIPASAVAWIKATNIAGEPRDTAVIDIRLGPPDTFLRTGVDAWSSWLLDWEALAKSALMVGALRAVRDLSVRYAREREQFGRPIASFQAVRQMGAVLAAEAAVAEAATLAVCDRIAGGDSWSFPVAAARLRTAESATVAARIAHQIHGAMGFTREHALHHFTRRLWSWRDEGLTEAQWSRIAGERVLAAGGDKIWELIAG
jgi:acyl-CoA dehydrogenase